jgi:predicted dehydrogenase
MKRIRVGIIGQGRSGRDIHGAYLVQDPKHYQIVAAADFLEDRRRRAVEEYKCDAYADYHELLKRKDLGLIINASYSHTHAPITLEILKAGHNVVCEKPLAKRAAEVDRLIAASKKSGKMLAIFQQSRSAPYFLQVRKVIDSGVLGRIVQISIAFNSFSRRWDWQTLQEYNGGSLLNTGPHPLDQALELFGDGMPKVTCFMDRANTWGDAEDYVKLILSGKGHPVIDLEISSCCAYPCFTYNVQGTRGGLKGNTQMMEWKYFKPSEAPKQKLTLTIKQEDGTPGYCREKLRWHEKKWEVSAAQSNLFNSMSAVFYRMIYNRLTRGVPLTTTPEQVRRQIAVIEECHRQNPQIYR